MNVQDVIVYVIMFLCVVYTGKHFLKSFRRRKAASSGCGCGGSGCPVAKKQCCQGDEISKK